MIRTEVEPKRGNYIYKCSNADRNPADSLLCMLNESFKANEVIYIIDQSVMNAINIQSSTAFQRIQIVDALLSTAERIRTQPEAMKQYAKSVLEVLHSFKPTDQQEFLTATSTSRDGAPALGAQALTDRLNFVISKIAAPCFAEKQEFNAQQWFSAGRTLAQAIQHVDAIRNFDRAAYDLEQTTIAMKRDQVIVGKLSTVEEGILQLLREHLPAGSTIECTEAEKTRNGYPDSTTYFGELTVHLNSGNFRSLIHTETSLQNRSSSISSGANAFDQDEYTYAISKSELLKKCVASS